MDIARYLNSDASRMTRTHQDITGHSLKNPYTLWRLQLGSTRMTITDVAEKIGVTPKTIVRWEKASKVSPAKRDWRGWRVYDKIDLMRLKAFKETIIYSEETRDDDNGSIL